MAGSPGTTHDPGQVPTSPRDHLAPRHVEGESVHTPRRAASQTLLSVLNGGPRSPHHHGALPSIAIPSTNPQSPIVHTPRGSSRHSRMGSSASSVHLRSPLSSVQLDDTQSASLGVEEQRAATSLNLLNLLNHRSPTSQHSSPGSQNGTPRHGKPRVVHKKSTLNPENSTIQHNTASSVNLGLAMSVGSSAQLNASRANMSLLNLINNAKHQKGLQTPGDKRKAKRRKAIKKTRRQIVADMLVNHGGSVTSFIQYQSSSNLTAALQKDSSTEREVARGLGYPQGISPALQRSNIRTRKKKKGGSQQDANEDESDSEGEEQAKGQGQGEGEMPEGRELTRAEKRARKKRELIALRERKQRQQEAEEFLRAETLRNQLQATESLLHRAAQKEKLQERLLERKQRRKNLHMFTDVSLATCIGVRAARKARNSLGSARTLGRLTSTGIGRETNDSEQLHRLQSIIERDVPGSDTDISMSQRDVSTPTEPLTISAEKLAALETGVVPQARADDMTSEERVQASKDLLDASRGNSLVAKRPRFVRDMTVAHEGSPDGYRSLGPKNRSSLAPISELSPHDNPRGIAAGRSGANLGRFGTVLDLRVLTELVGPETGIHLPEDEEDEHVQSEAVASELMEISRPRHRRLRRASVMVAFQNVSKFSEVNKTSTMVPFLGTTRAKDVPTGAPIQVDTPEGVSDEPQALIRARRKSISISRPSTPASLLGRLSHPPRESPKSSPEQQRRTQPSPSSTDGEPAGVPLAASRSTSPSHSQMSELSFDSESDSSSSDEMVVASSQEIQGLGMMRVVSDDASDISDAESVHQGNGVTRTPLRAKVALALSGLRSSVLSIIDTHLNSAWRLRFHDALEEAYEKEVVASYTHHWRMCILFGLMMTVAFFLADVTPGETDTFFVTKSIWRFAGGVPFLLCCYYGVGTSWFKRRPQFYLTMMAIVFGLGITLARIITDLTEPPTALNLYLIFLFGAGRMGYLHVLTASLVVSISYMVLAAASSLVPGRILVVHMFDLVTAIVVGTARNFVNEIAMRQHFVLRREFLAVESSLTQTKDTEAKMLHQAMPKSFCPPDISGILFNNIAKYQPQAMVMKLRLRFHSKTLSDPKSITVLRTVISAADSLVMQCDHIEKIATRGSDYLVGVSSLSGAQSVLALAEFCIVAVRIRDVISRLNRKSQVNASLYIAMHSGPAITGFIVTTQSIAFDICGPIIDELNSVLGSISGSTVPTAIKDVTRDKGESIIVMTPRISAIVQALPHVHIRRLTSKEIPHLADLFPYCSSLVEVDRDMHVTVMKEKKGRLHQHSTSLGPLPPLAIKDAPGRKDEIPGDTKEEKDNKGGNDHSGEATVLNTGSDARVVVPLSEDEIATFQNKNFTHRDFLKSVRLPSLSFTNSEIEEDYRGYYYQDLKWLARLSMVGMIFAFISMGVVDYAVLGLDDTYLEQYQWVTLVRYVITGPVYVLTGLLSATRLYKRHMQVVVNLFACIPVAHNLYILNYLASDNPARSAYLTFLMHSLIQLHISLYNRFLPATIWSGLALGYAVFAYFAVWHLVFDSTVLWLAGAVCVGMMLSFQFEKLQREGYLWRVLCVLEWQQLDSRRAHASWLLRMSLPRLFLDYLADEQMHNESNARSEVKISKQHNAGTGRSRILDPNMSSILHKNAFVLVCTISNLNDLTAQCQEGLPSHLSKLLTAWELLSREHGCKNHTPEFGAFTTVYIPDDDGEDDGECEGDIDGAVSGHVIMAELALDMRDIALQMSKQSDFPTIEISIGIAHGDVRVAPIGDFRVSLSVFGPPVDEAWALSVYNANDVHDPAHEPAATNHLHPFMSPSHVAHRRGMGSHSDILGSSVDNTRTPEAYRLPPLIKNPLLARLESMPQMSLSDLTAAANSGLGEGDATDDDWDHVRKKKSLTGTHGSKKDNIRNAHTREPGPGMYLASGDPLLRVRNRSSENMMNPANRITVGRETGEGIQEVYLTESTLAQLRVDDDKKTGLLHIVSRIHDPLLPGIVSAVYVFVVGDDTQPAMLTQDVPDFEQIRESINEGGLTELKKKFEFWTTFAHEEDEGGEGEYANELEEWLE